MLINTAVRKVGPASYLFSQNLVEIAVYDRRGRRLWHRRKSSETEALCWMGQDPQGNPVGVGSYIFKLLGLNGDVSYMPFILD